MTLRPMATSTLSAAEAASCWSAVSPWQSVHTSGPKGDDISDFTNTYARRSALSSGAELARAQHSCARE
jgi:hypothetical protein